MLFVRAEHLDRFTDRYIGAAPDLVVEVSSPSTRRTDVVRKRALYERFAVPEYWFVDLDADRIEVYLLEGDRYPTPTLAGARRGSSDRRCFPACGCRSTRSWWSRRPDRASAPPTPAGRWGRR